MGPYILLLLFILAFWAGSSRFYDYLFFGHSRPHQKKETQIKAEAERKRKYQEAKQKRLEEAQRLREELEQLREKIKREKEERERQKEEEVNSQ